MCTWAFIEDSSQGGENMEGGWFKALPIFSTTRNKIGLLRSAYGVVI